MYTGENCPICGKPLVERRDAKNNVFVACSGYPSCNYIAKDPTKEIDESKIVKKCPSCETGYLIKKRGKYGYFLGCSNYPECNHMEKITKRRRK